MNLYRASSEWASRPNDQRFWTLSQLYQATREGRAASHERTIARVRVYPDSDGVRIGDSDHDTHDAPLTHWAFGQLAQRAGAPAGYLRTLPALLVVDCLTAGLAGNGGPASLLVTGSTVVALTSERYARLWDADVVARLLPLAGAGWRVPPARPCRADMPGARPATADDILEDTGQGGGLSVNVGDLIAPAGLYASDHDVFAFLVNEHATLDDGAGGRLSRGLMVWNSEVGAASFGLMTFLYAHVCGNHIVWNVKSVVETRLRHIGAIGERARSMYLHIREYADSPAGDDEARILRARSYEVGKDPVAIVDAIFKLRVPVLSKERITGAVVLASQREDRYGNPRSAWALSNALSELSQATPYTDDRVTLDRAAGRVLDMVPA